MPEEIASNCWTTPPDQVALVHGFFGDVPDFDPFHDPASIIGARVAMDVRNGWDAYRDDWNGIRVPDGPVVKVPPRDGDIVDVTIYSERPWRTSLVNAPYSSDNPKRTARRVAQYASKDREILNLCPAAPGSRYWRRHIWARANAIAWLGRLAFVAGRDMFDKKGNPIAKAGELLTGNRTEIAMVYTGADPYRFWQTWAAWEVTVLRNDVITVGAGSPGTRQPEEC